MTARDDKTFAVVAKLADWIAAEGARSAIIGGMALAFHGYSRSTVDVDLATELDPAIQMRELAAKARAEGWRVELEMPDREDPLGGVLTAKGDDFDPVQVVNFHNPFRTTPNPAREALIGAVEFRDKPGLKVVRIEDLIMLKLFAGGFQSLGDVQALLAANPEVDRGALRDRAARYGLEQDLERALS